MEKHSLFVFAKDLSRCKCYDTLKKEYIIFHTPQKEEFLENIKQEDISAGIICFASREPKINEVFNSSDLTTKLPILLCSEKINSEYINLAVHYGVNRFITFNMNHIEMKEIIVESISLGRVKVYLKSLIVNKAGYSSYSGKLIDIIADSFPKRLNENDMAKELNISVRYIQKMCKECFNYSYSRLLRRIRVYNALRLMDNTSLDNYEISLHLIYAESSSMIRDFIKELGYSPAEAKELLKTQTPKEQMLNKPLLPN